MNESDYLAILNEQDDPAAWERPSDFNGADETDRFNRLASMIDQEFGMQCRRWSGPQSQDSSFLGQIELPSNIYRDKAAESNHRILRISNFGRMAAIYGDNLLHDAFRVRIQSILERNGYRLIPMTILQQPYTGKNPGVTGISTWWIRYFDWI